MSNAQSERRGAGKTGWALLILLIAAIAGVVAVGWLPRQSRASRLEAQARENAAPPRVLVEPISAAPPMREIVLPATTEARESVAVRAHVDGYVHAVRADLGARVRRGQVLAEIAAPERDAEINAITARIGEAEQRVALARSTTERIDRLGERGVMTTQERDDARLSLHAAAATLDSSRAELRRLQTLRGYQRILAPFDGVVTSRAIELGALVSASGTPLFVVSSPEIEADIDVPQEHAAAVSPGIEVELLDRGRSLAVVPVARVASTLDAVTRAMRVELDVPPGAPLIAGMFLRAKLRLPRMQAAVLLPSRALVVDNEGSAAWVVDEGRRARLKRLVVARDLGSSLEISAGLAVGERVVLSPPDGLRDGALVDPLERGAASAPASAQGAPPPASSASPARGAR